MTKILIITGLIILFFVSCNQNKEPAESANDSISKKFQSGILTYDIPIDKLMEINVVDSYHVEYEPTYEISISDLMKMEIVKDLSIDTSLGISYDFPLSDLMKIEIPVYQKDSTKLKPTYEMSMQGLLEFTVNPEYNIEEHIEISYDLSLDGLMKIRIKNLEKKEMKQKNK
jgi:hypothetical protein